MSYFIFTHENYYFSNFTTYYEFHTKQVKNSVIIIFILSIDKISQSLYEGFQTSKMKKKLYYSDKSFLKRLSKIIEIMIMIGFP